MDMAFIDGLGGILKTNEEFIIVIYEKIHGPFKNERIEEILALFKGENK